MLKAVAFAACIAMLSICTAQDAGIEPAVGNPLPQRPEGAPVYSTRADARRAAHRDAARARVAKRSKDLHEVTLQSPAQLDAKRAPVAQTGLSGVELQQMLEKVQQSVKNREQSTEDILAQEIGALPAAEIFSGVDDISSTGACRGEINSYCLGMMPGYGRFADCLTQRLNLTPELATQGHFTKECVQDLEVYRRERARNINMNLPLAKACKKDVKKLCPNEADTESIMWCLRSQSDALRQRCHKQIFESLKVAADDIRASPALYDACKADIKDHCASISSKGGEVQYCLGQAGSKLHWDCREQLHLNAIANAGDIRLSTRMFLTCLEDKKTFCPLVEPGYSRAITCLEGHRGLPGFSNDCRQMLENAMSERSMDFRLEPNMKEACKEDIENTCGVELDQLNRSIKEKAKVEDDGLVSGCLQDYRLELQNPECALAVKVTMVRAAEDERFDVSVSISCAEDRRNFCQNVEPGSARVWACLQRMRSKLSSDCKLALFDSEVSAAESIDFQYPLKTACHREMSHFCRKIPHEHGKVIRCLQENEMHALFSEECRDELRQHDHHAAHDYRLKSRLKNLCSDVIHELCRTVNCPADGLCGGLMLQCLTNQVNNINNTGCRNEVLYYQRMEVLDFENDVMVAEACHKDVDKFCKNVLQGVGRMHECLNNHLHQLSPACAKEEVNLMAATAGNIELQPSLARDCADERAEHCSDVQPGMSRITNCLIAKADTIRLSRGCRKTLEDQLEGRLRDWRLAFNLRQDCAGDVGQFCSREDSESSNQEAKGQVLQCLINQQSNLHPECTFSVTRSIHGSLKFYHPGSPITGACDTDVKERCIPPGTASLTRWRVRQDAQSSSLGAMAPLIPIGQVLSCLELEQAAAGASDGVAVELVRMNTSSTASSDSAEPVAAPGTALAKGCAALVEMGRPEPFSDYLEALSSSRLATTLRKVQDSLNLPEETLVATTAARGEPVVQGLTLTGWSAVAGSGAITLVVILAIVGSWVRFVSARYSNYQMVTKAQRPAEVQMR